MPGSIKRISDVEMSMVLKHLLACVKDCPSDLCDVELEAKITLASCNVWAQDFFFHSIDSIIADKFMLGQGYSLPLLVI